MIPLLANAGTALMWFSALHLLLGNAAVGVAESVVLRLGFRVPVRRAIPWMVAANYTSMIVGAVAVQACGAIAGVGDLPPDGARRWLVAAVVVFWGATVLIEWPFVAKAMGEGPRRWPRAFRASLVAQTASYSVLVAIYLVVAPMSALTRTTTADAAEIASLVPDGTRARVYFKADGPPGAWWTVPIDGGAPRPAASVPEGVTEPDPNSTSDFGDATDLSGGPWAVRTGFWAAQGLSAENRTTHEHLRLALETPFLTWRSRDATILPGGVVVYALGPHIVSLDLATRRLAVLAQGRSPVVVMEESLR